MAFLCVFQFLNPLYRYQREREWFLEQSHTWPMSSYKDLPPVVASALFHFLFPLIIVWNLRLCIGCRLRSVFSLADLSGRSEVACLISKWLPNISEKRKQSSNLFNWAGLSSVDTKVSLPNQDFWAELVSLMLIWQWAKSYLHIFTTKNQASTQ